MTNAEARFNKIHIRKVYACLAVTCHLHRFWQNDRDFLRATVVTRGWNGYRNKSQHRKSTLEKKILPPFQQGFEPATFQSRVRCSNHWAIPAPFLAARAALLSMRARILCVLKIVCCCTIKPDCRLRLLWSPFLTDSAACVLSFYHSIPLQRQWRNRGRMFKSSFWAGVLWGQF